MQTSNATRAQRHFDEHSEQYVERYLEASIALYRKKNAFLRRFVHYQPGSPLSVLDLGSGGGIWADLFLDDYPWASVFCVDISSVMLRKNRLRPGKYLLLADALKLPFRQSAFDLISMDALLHHLVDSRGYLETVLKLTGFLRWLKTLLKPGGKVIIREIYHESILRAEIMSYVLFHLSTLRSPRFLASLIAMGIRSQGAGICFLTREQWAAVIDQAGYSILGKEEHSWNVPLSRRLAGLRASGDMFLLLSPTR